MSAFGYDDFLRNTIDHSMREYPHKVGLLYFERTDLSGFLSPLTIHPEYWTHRRELNLIDPLSFYQFYRDAELLRQTLVDESVPYRTEKCIYGWYDGGRNTNAIALGEIKYWPALPELREAMLHDYDLDLRIYCLGAITLIGRRARFIARDIREAITKNTDSYFRTMAVEALEEIAESDSAPFLRDLYEETRSLIHQKSAADIMRYDTWDLLLLRSITTALISLDKETARECLAIGLLDANPHVYYFTKSAFDFSSDYNQMRLMASNPRLAIGFLPNDPTLDLSQRKRA